MRILLMLGIALALGAVGYFVAAAYGASTVPPLVPTTLPTTATSADDLEVQIVRDQDEAFQQERLNDARQQYGVVGGGVGLALGLAVGAVAASKLAKKD